MRTNEFGQAIGDALPDLHRGVCQLLSGSKVAIP